MLTSQQLHALQFCLGEFKRISNLLAQAQAGCAGIAEVIQHSGLPVTPVSIDYTQTSELLGFLHDQLQREHYAQLFPGVVSKFDRAVSPQPETVGEEVPA